MHSCTRTSSWPFAIRRQLESPLPFALADERCGRCRPHSFLLEPWNYLDSVVVVVGCISLARVDLGAARQLKILRSLRIVRLFKRVKSLNQILVALLRSIPGLINALVVLVRLPLPPLLPLPPRLPPPLRPPPPSRLHTRTLPPPYSLRIPPAHPSPALVRPRPSSPPRLAADFHDDLCHSRGGLLS